MSFSFLDFAFKAYWHIFSYFTSYFVIFSFYYVKAIWSSYKDLGRLFSSYSTSFIILSSSINFDSNFLSLFLTSFYNWPILASFTLLSYSISAVLFISSCILVLFPFHISLNYWCLEARIIYCICKASYAFISLFMYLSNRFLSSQSSQIFVNLPVLGCFLFFLKCSLQTTKLQNPLFINKNVPIFFLHYFFVANPTWLCRLDYNLLSIGKWLFSDRSDDLLSFFLIKEIFESLSFLFLLFDFINERVTDLFVDFDGTTIGSRVIGYRLDFGIEILRFLSGHRNK